MRLSFLPAAVVVILLLVVQDHAAYAQDKPSVFIATKNDYSEILPHRQDLCDRHAKVDSGELHLEDAIRGLSINAIFLVDDYFRIDPETGGVDENFPGVIGSKWFQTSKPSYAKPEPTMISSVCSAHGRILLTSRMLLAGELCTRRGARRRLHLD